MVYLNWVCPPPLCSVSGRPHYVAGSVLMNRGLDPSHQSVTPPLLSEVLRPSALASFISEFWPPAASVGGRGHGAGTGRSGLLSMLLKVRVRQNSPETSASALFCIFCTCLTGGNVGMFINLTGLLLGQENPPDALLLCCELRFPP